MTGSLDCRLCVSGRTAQPVKRNRSHFLVSKTSSPNPACMIVPFRHVENPFDFTAEEWADLGELVTEAKRVLDQFQPDGFTIGWNVGEAGGQHIFHAHMHVICRYNKDGGRGLRDLLQTR